MQSFLQYRRFGIHIRKQYERDKSRARSLDKHDSTVPASSSPDSPLSDQSRSNSDLEKAERPISDSQDTKTSALKNAEPPANATENGMPPEPGTVELTARTTSVVARMGTNLGQALTGVSVRDRTTQEGKEKGKVFVVGYEGDHDSMNPHNWGYGARIMATINVAAIGWIVGFASSVDSAALEQASMDFGVSEVAESLATGIFLIGFGVGALFAGPVSETVGRNPVYIATLSLYMVFVMASALAPNIGAQVTFRFIAGCFAATPLTCAGGSISDLWSPMERTYAFPVFANSAFMGPIFGPVVGGFVGSSPLLKNWRWTEWITLIISGGVLIQIFLFQPETYAPILLKWKAAHLRALTGDDRYKAQVEIRGESFPRRLGRALYRPFLLMFREPIIILVALYLSVIYIVLFTFLNGYTFIFTGTYKFTQGITGLSFLGIGVGLCLASGLVPLIYYRARRDLAKIKAEGGTHLAPEFRLLFGMFGAPAIPISLFWMGWTAYPSVSYWSPLAASVLFGYGILCVFISSYQYIIDSYESYSASALASVTLIRYVAAGGMIEVAIPFYKNLGVHWTLTVLGGISAVCVPVPYLFYVFGTRIRGWSRYAIV